VRIKPQISLKNDYLRFFSFKKHAIIPVHSQNHIRYNNEFLNHQF
jgi:hypothetical protein